MFSAVEMTVAVLRVCGHSENQEIRYKGTNDKQQIMHFERQRLCKACKQKITDWFSNSVAPHYPLGLPNLVGSDKQVSWATRLRDGKAFQLTKVMSQGADEGDKTGIALWQAIYAYLNQHQAKYWIDTREEVFGPDYFALEASYFLMVSAIGVHFSPRSVYGRLREKAPYRIQEIKRLTPERRQADESQSQSAG